MATVYVWNSAGKLLDEVLFVQAIQGITSREKPLVYIMFPEKYEPYNLWLGETQKKYGFETAEVTDIWELADKFKDKLNGYVLYPQAGTQTMNYAATLAGVLDALPITPRLKAAAESCGFKLLKNADEYTGIDKIISEYGGCLNKKMFLNQDPQDFALRDYGIKHKSLIVCPPEQAGLDLVYDFVEPNAVLFGWYTAGQGGEIGGVHSSSLKQVITIASDHSMNMSFLEEKSSKVFEQKKPVDNSLKAEPGKHYIAFVYSDGDNVQWMLNSFPVDPKRFAHDKSEKIPFGWSMSPGLADFAPSVLDYTYKTAAPTDNFVAAVSGYGYIHPGKYYDINALNEFGELTAEYMKRTDLHYTEILEENGINGDAVEQKETVWNAYTRNNQIKGILYKTGDRYVAGRGFLKWSNNKPVVAFRETLWTLPDSENTNIGKTANESIYKMAYRISQYDKNYQSINGYTLINVHAWSHDYESVKKLTNWLKEYDSDVVVVTPDTLMRLIAENAEKTDTLPNKNWNDTWDYSSVAHLYGKEGA